MEKCERCNIWGTDIGSDATTDWDKATIVHGAQPGHPLGVAVLVLSGAAKLMLSTVYECRICKQRWRKWF